MDAGDAFAPGGACEAEDAEGQRSEEEEVLCGSAPTADAGGEAVEEPEIDKCGESVAVAFCEGAGEGGERYGEEEQPEECWGLEDHGNERRSPC